MATVLRARDVRHDRVVAIKVLHPELSEALGLERFMREVRITARLNHPHILPLLDSGEVDGLLFYVMPFVDGETLRERIQREGELPLDDAVRLTREVAEALGYAHALGIVHRDIKPENILLQGGHALVADFGIARDVDSAKLTTIGVTVGTPLYMSPEQASGATVIDGRSDQYSLGCVTYELLTGEPPFMGPTPMAITARKLTESLPSIRSRRTTVSAPVEAALSRALERAPSDRFRTMHEFVGALTTPVSAETPLHSGRPSRIPWMIAAVVVLVAGAIGWATLGGSKRQTVAEESAIAVLPFENLSADSSQSYFAEGLADELVTSLSMVEGMRVASRTSTSALIKRGLDMEAIAKELRVGTVLEGSLRLVGDRMRVSTRLVNVGENRPVWSQSYERPIDDVLRIQEEIATAIVTALRGRLLQASIDAVSSGTTDPEAYNLYLQGRALRRRQTEQTLAGAAERFQRAIERAPDFARAHAALAETYAVQGWYDFRPPRETFPAALDAAAIALKLDPQNASAFSTTAYALLYYEWDLPAAERAFLKALAADPNSAIAHQWYGNYLTVAQRWEEAEQEFRMAMRLDPTSPLRLATQIWVKSYGAKYEEAIEAYKLAAAFDSTYALTFQWGAIALEEGGRLDEAHGAMARAVVLSDSGTTFVAGLARLEAVRGNRVAARALLSQVMNANVVPAFDVAKIHLALGDRAEAMRWFERAYEARAHAMLFLRIDPHLKPLRGDPAFEALAKKVGI